MKKSIIRVIFYNTFFSIILLSSSCNRDDNNTTPTTETISCNDINSDVTWVDRGADVDYILTCVVQVNAKLTIEPGVTIEVRNGAGIIVEDAGSFVAAGTASKNIIFKSNQDVAGVWKGIFIRSNNVLNEINYCQISNGGSASFDGNSTKLANIRLALDAKLKLQNSTISKSAKDGLLADGLDFDELNPIASFSNNVFTGNQNYPISVLGASANVLDQASVYTANTNNKVLLRGGHLYGTHTWKKLAVPYLIESIVSVGYTTNNGNLTIQPGVTIQFAGDAGLCTGNYSTGSWMNVTGTASDRITLTGETAAPGAWKGIAFQSTSPNNTITYTDISYGGSSSYTGNTSQLGNVIAGAWSGGSFAISNTNISNSAAYGIYVTMPSPTIAVPGSVVYSGNASGNYFEE